MVRRRGAVGGQGDEGAGGHSLAAPPPRGVGRAFPSSDEDDADIERIGTGEPPSGTGPDETDGGDALGEMVRSLTGTNGSDGSNPAAPLPSRPPPPPGAPTDAALSCSLAVFDLGAVLTLLSTTGQSGMLTVVGAPGGTLHLDGGALVDTVDGREPVVDTVFELLLSGVGSCFFSPGRPGFGTTQPVERRAVDEVLAEVRPRLSEWHELRGALPDDAVVRLSPTPPGDDVHIPARLWGILTSVDRSGRPVVEIVDSADGEPAQILKDLATLHTLGLVTVDPGGPGTPAVPGSTGPTTPLRTDATTTFPGSCFDQNHGPEDVDPCQPEVGDPDDPVDVMVLPPPIVDDPWSPLPQHRADPPADGEAATDTPSLA